MTQFGFVSHSNSPARRRIDAIGRASERARRGKLAGYERRREALAAIVAQMEQTRDEIEGLKAELKAARRGLLLKLEHELPTIWVKDARSVVSRHFGVPIADLKSDRRDKETTLARQVGMYLERKLTPYSWTEIGRRFGGKDHTTVIHSVNAVKRKMAADESLADAVNDLLVQLSFPQRSTG